MQDIYIVEDDISIRELIVYALKTAEFNVLGFESGACFFEEIEKKLPSLVLLDIMLPKDNGIEILKKLKSRENTKNLPVIMLTAKGSEIDKVTALDLGADDYITKPFGVMEMISRVKAVLRRSKNNQEEEILKLDKLTLNKKSRKVYIESNEISLTYKEFELLYYLLKNKNMVLSRDQIMQAVWGFDFEGESRTVDMHIKLLRQKLLDMGDKIKTVRSIGYQIEE